MISELCGLTYNNMGFNEFLESAIWGGWENVPPQDKWRLRQLRQRNYEINTEQFNEHDVQEEQ